MTDRRQAAGAVVIREDGRVLLIRRGRPPGAGEWTLPGGKVEPGETPAEAIVRELREETGLAIEVVAALGVVPLDRGGFSYAIHEHLCVPRAGQPETLCPADDAADARWVHPSDLARYSVTPAVAAVVAEALARWGGAR
ncbi:MAG TPA: NUDIX hydrolase [Polyangiaceae bacterium]|jgi:mutator protein MutT